MDTEKDHLKERLMAQLSARLDQVLQTSTVTFSDIENIVAEFQRQAGKEIAEGLLDLKKNRKKAP